MVERIVPLAVSLALAATAGCFSRPPSVASSPADQSVNLSGGAATKDGFTKVTVTVEGLDAMREIQSFNTQGASMSLVVTQPNHDKVVDANGDDAVYEAKVTGGSVTLTLPGLPNSTASIKTTAPYYDVSSAYIFTVLLFKNDPGGTPSLADLANYGTSVGTGYRYDRLWYDVATGSINLVGSGAVRADVAPGLPINVPVVTWSHINSFFQANATDSFEYDKAVANSVVIAPSGNNSAGIVSENGTNILRLRMPGLDKTTLDGVEKKVRFALAFNAAVTTAPTITGTVFSPDTAIESANLSGASNTSLIATVPTSVNTTTTTANANKTWYKDVDFTSLSAGKQVIDLQFKGFSTYGNLRLLPLNHLGIFSNDNGQSNFN